MTFVVAKAKSFFHKKLDSQSKILFKNSTWVLGSNIFGFFLGFIRSIVLARQLGVEIFGAYTLVINFAGVVIEIFNLNVGTAIIKFGASYKAENRIDKLVALVKGCTIASITSFALAVLVLGVLLKYFYASFFASEGLELYTVFYSIALAIFMFAATLSNSLLRLFFKFKNNSIISMIMDTVELLLIVAALFLYPNNLVMFFAAVIVSKLFNGVICLVAVLWEVKSDLKTHVQAKSKLLFDQRKEIRGFVFTNSISGTLKTVINKGDILILGILGSNSMVAFYSIAKKLAYSILVITDPLMNAIFPQLSKLIAEKKYDEMINMLRKVTKIFLYPSLAALGIIFVLKGWIIELVFGAQYLPAAEPFFYLMIVSLLIAVFFWNLSMIQSLGLINFRFVVYVLAIIFGGGASYFLIPLFGANGAAFGLLVAYIIITGCFVGISYKKLNQLKASAE